MVKSNVIQFLDIKILIFETPIADIYGLKEYKGNFYKLLDRAECEKYKLMEIKERINYEQ